MPSTPRQTIGSQVTQATEILAAAGCPRPRDDAETIIADALALTPAVLRRRAREHIQNDTLASLIDERIRRRGDREPVEYIVGRCRFRQIELLVDHRVLVPAEDIPLVDIALHTPHEGRVHDVGTGSGAIALAIKDERPDLIVSGSDISPAAVDVARINADHLGLDVHFSVADGLPVGKYDLVVANLPFQDFERRTNDDGPELTRHQPHVAIFGGSDGLDVIRSVLASIPSGTRVALLHAASQAPTVQALVRDPETLGAGDADNCVTIGQVA